MYEYVARAHTPHTPRTRHKPRTRHTRAQHGTHGTHDTHGTHGTHRVGSSLLSISSSLRISLYRVLGEGQSGPQWAVQTRGDQRDAQLVEVGRIVRVVVELLFDLRGDAQHRLAL